MPILKVETIEAIGIIATIAIGTITSGIFIGVLIYQIRATRSATAQAARLRPHIVIEGPQTLPLRMERFRIGAGTGVL